jgi:hypothetical protein
MLRRAQGWMANAAGSARDTGTRNSRRPDCNDPLAIPFRPLPESSGPAKRIFN